MNHTVVISDVHLCQAVPGDDLWMRYRQRRFFPDEEFAALFERLHTEARGEPLTLVFNGDLFDFDAPPVIDGEVHLDGAPRDQRAATAALISILEDHKVFVDSLGAMLACGHTIVFVSGNHDAQLAWPDVRTAMHESLLDAAHAHGAVDSSLPARVVFRTWFHHTPDGIHIEHGNQYDHYCAFRYPTDPFTADGSKVQPTMGSLSFRHLVARMGYFNPHVDSTFMLSGSAYVAHWARYYARSKHSLGGAWARGAMNILTEMFSHRQTQDARRAARCIESGVGESGADPDAVKRHAALFAAPADERAHSVLRELWLDRIALGTAGAIAVGAAAIGGAVPAAALAAGTVGAFAAYELLLPKPLLEDTYSHVFRRQIEIAQIHNARAVVFGHTHQPFARWDNGVFHGNSGTWSAAFLDPECTRPIDLGRPVIWLRTDERAVEGGLYQWTNGLLREHRERQLSAPAPAGIPALG